MTPRPNAVSPAPQHCIDCPAWKQSAFHALTPAELDALARSKTSRSYERGETFSEQGKPIGQVYCIARGSAKVTRTNRKQGETKSESHRESLVRLARPGDLLGYRCIFSEETYRATAYALEPSAACTIDSSRIYELIRSNPEFTMELLKRMGREIASAENRHHSFCQRDSRERIAEALLLLMDSGDRRALRSSPVRIPLTRVELSNWVGVAKETVIRCLSDFKEEGLIRQDEDSLVILDPARLTGIARFED